MYIVTGGAGFIGSNLVHELNRSGITNILVVDNFSDLRKMPNLDQARFVDYMDKHEFRRALEANSLGIQRVDAIFHQGACSNTLVDDGVYMMDNNFTYSKAVLAYAIKQGAPLVYASTAAVYGLSGPGHFAPSIENERPLNVYGFSKLVFDNYVRELFSQGRVPSSVVGLRYFNVYGPREAHKGRMASVIHQFAKQMQETGKVRLFAGSGGYGDGEQRRDFVYVRDVARLNLYFAHAGPYAANAKRDFHTIVNVGSGESRTFNDVARALMHVLGEVPLEYIPMPQDLEGRYQHFTEADLNTLRKSCGDYKSTQLNEGIRETFEVLRSVEQEALHHAANHA